MGAGDSEGGGTWEESGWEGDRKSGESEEMVDVNGVSVVQT
jgi:hypothetical protein